jgi:Methyltransferase FkbM domain
MRQAKGAKDAMAQTAASTNPGTLHDEHRPFSRTPTLAQRAVIELVRRVGFENGAMRKYGGKLVDALRAGPVDYDYHGLTLRHLPGQCASSRHMLMTPAWSERAERHFIEAHLPRDGVFVDVGANAGFFTFFVAGRHPDCRVVAFEPLPEFAQRIDYDIKANRLANVSIVASALWDEDGTVEVEGRTVPAMTLPRAVAEQKLDRIDVMKIDVEGVEDRILMPFFRAAPKSLWPKAMLIEHIFARQWHEDCLAFALANGYREKWRDRLNAALILDA